MFLSRWNVCVCISGECDYAIYVCQLGELLWCLVPHSTSPHLRQCDIYLLAPLPALCDYV